MGKELIINQGDVFGKLTIISETIGMTQPNGVTVRAFFCKCECGNIKRVRLLHLKHGRVKSCGCLVGEKHGLCKSQIYTVWRGMKNRCYGVKYKEKQYYQDKGIIMCDEWKNSFTSFYMWSLVNGYKEGLTIDRKESNKNYTPDNSRWVTPFENMINSGASSKIVYHGNEIYLAEMWKNDYFRNHMGAIRSRIKRGYNIDAAFDTPFRVGNYRSDSRLTN